MAGDSRKSTYAQSQAMHRKHPATSMLGCDIQDERRGRFRELPERQNGNDRHHQSELEGMPTMSHATEQIPPPDSSVPLPWLVEPWSAVDPAPDPSTSSAASAAPFDFRANVSQEPRAVTTDQRPMAPEVIRTQPQQGNPASQPTAGGVATAPVLLLTGLGVLVLVLILIMLVGAGHGAAFSGAHGLHHVPGVTR